MQMHILKIFEKISNMSTKFEKNFCHVITQITYKLSFLNINVTTSTNL